MLLSFMIITSMGTVVQAASVRSDNVVHQGKTNGKYYVQAYFNPSHKVVSGEGFGLTAGKYVKQAAVRTQSNGKTVLGVKICSSYETITDCSTCVQKTSYKWKYFK